MISSGHRQIKWEMESLLFARFLYAIIVATIATLLLSWNLFFILVAGYSIFESVGLFIIIRRIELIKAELDNDGEILTPVQRMEISSDSSHYACAYAMVGFFLSFGMISFFGALAKWILALFFG